MKKLLLAAALVVGLSAPAVDAQTTNPLQTLATQIQTAINDVINVGANLVTVDLNLAIADAQAQNNTTAAACWTTIKSLNFTALPTGAGLAYLKQRLLDFAAQYTAMNNNCQATAPALLKLYNNAVMQLNQFPI